MRQLRHVFSPLTIVAELLACFTNTKGKFNKQSHARKSVRGAFALYVRASRRLENSKTAAFENVQQMVPPGLCVEVGAGERLESELETREELEQGVLARLSDKERRLFNWLS